MDIDILKRGLKLVEYIYDNQVPDLELYRIKEVGNGLADSHWKSKQWLVDELSEYIEDEDVHIAAGWLGLTAYLLKKQFPNINITNSDFDPGCKVMGEFLFDGYSIDYKTLDTVLDINKISNQCQVYINTSLEHIQQDYVEKIFASLRRGTIIAVQSNNYYTVEEHINCCESLDNFVSKVNVSEVLFKGSMPFEHYDRYMIIGVV